MLNQMNCVLSLFSFKRLALIQWLISSTPSTSLRSCNTAWNLRCSRTTAAMPVTVPYQDAQCDLKRSDRWILLYLDIEPGRHNCYRLCGSKVSWKNFYCWNSRGVCPSAPQLSTAVAKLLRCVVCTNFNFVTFWYKLSIYRLCTLGLCFM